MATHTILIADDDSSLCRVLTVRCENHGLKVLTAHDVMQTLLMTHKYMPDLIIMDISMPAGNGLSACEMLRSDPRMAGLPIIVLSGTARDEDVQRCGDLGVRFVAKQPDAWLEVRAAMNELLGVELKPAKVLGTAPSNPERVASTRD